MEGSGTYVLEDIFGLSPYSLNSLRNNQYVFTGNKFYHYGAEDCMGFGVEVHHGDGNNVIIILKIYKS
ncbi:MAG: hypothetical protein IPO92_13600 [Saprospiraceae bacterium]|nr:hypothetical protein [Saprospiraceae bacterium]